MDLVERYLQAVRHWLPTRQAHDIIAELSEDIQSQIDERQAALGRPLTDTEVEAMLVERGRPMLVASRYLPQESLIGPELFPVYRFVLKIVLLCSGAPAVLALVSLIVFGPGSPGDGPRPWLAYLGPLWGTFISSAFIAASTVTLLFAVLDRLKDRAGLLDAWQPGKLPPVRDPSHISRASSSIEVAANLIFLVWCAAYLGTQRLIDVPELRVTAAPQWMWFYWGFVAMTLANIAFSCYNLVRPRWTMRRAALRLVIDAAGSTLFCWLMVSHPLASITGAHIPPDKGIALVTTINEWMARLMPYAVLVGVAIALGNGYRMFRINTERMRRLMDSSGSSSSALHAVSGRK
jgi:hypothetical protein